MREGGPYAAADGSDFGDNALRFAALAKVGALIGQGLVPAFVPQVVHAHDWQAGLTAAYLHYSGRPAPRQRHHRPQSRLPGPVPRRRSGALGLPPQAFSIEGVEYYGGVGFLKAGLQLSDRITTVSPTYAQEIQTTHAGMGLDGLLRTRAGDLTGILNGIDTNVWNPETDPLIAAPYSAKAFGRAVNKKALQERFGLARDDKAFLVGVVSRLSWQKGLDLLLDCLPILDACDAQLALLASGDPGLEAAFQEAAQTHPGRVGVYFGYEEKLAHLIQAGADAMLVPSRFEPCGLTQLCALRYGAAPIVARVGGLADTVIDANEMALQAGCATGLQFAPSTSEALSGALRRGADLFRQKKLWKKIQTNGMKTDVQLDPSGEALRRNLPRAGANRAMNILPARRSPWVCGSSRAAPMSRFFPRRPKASTSACSTRPARAKSPACVFPAAQARCSMVSFPACKPAPSTVFAPTARSRRSAACVSTRESCWSIRSRMNCTTSRACTSPSFRLQKTTAVPTPPRRAPASPIRRRRAGPRFRGATRSSTNCMCAASPGCTRCPGSARAGRSRASPIPPPSRT